MAVSVEASALLRCLRTIDLCLVLGSIDKDPKTSVTQLLVYAYNIPEEHRPELHLSGKCEVSQLFLLCVQIGTIYIICSVCKGCIQPVFFYLVLCQMRVLSPNVDFSRLS